MYAHCHVVHATEDAVVTSSGLGSNATRSAYQNREIEYVYLTHTLYVQYVQDAPMHLSFVQVGQLRHGTSECLLRLDTYVVSHEEALFPQAERIGKKLPTMTAGLYTNQHTTPHIYQRRKKTPTHMLWVSRRMVKEKQQRSVG